jgi:hypothetical protein
MKYFAVLTVFVVALAFTMRAQQPRQVTVAPDEADRSKILDAVREYALNYSETLPNFICTQVTRRQVDPTGTGDHFREEDKLQEQLSYFEHHESYKIMAVNGQMVMNKDREKLGGAMSSGEFGSMLAEIFAPDSETEFHWSRLGKLDGVIMNVFEYRITQPRSHYRIEERISGRSIIAGYHGLIYATRDSNAVMRVTLECEDIPADFPIQDVKLDLWYGVKKISDREFVLPVKWDLHSRQGRLLSWNSAEFTLYRKYSADTTITFESDDDPKPPVKKKQ